VDQVYHLAADIADRLWRIPPAARVANQRPTGSRNRCRGDVIEVTGWPEACACQEGYGFSQFGIRSGGCAYRAGRLGADRFRFFGPMPEPIRQILTRIAPGAAMVHMLEAVDAPQDKTPAYRIQRMERPF
jgi:hypothetical protein